MRLFTALAFITSILAAQPLAAITKTPDEISGDTTRSVTASGKKTEWYQRISLKGYVQLRYNRLLETNSELKCEQCDKSWGGTGGFSLRRVRLVFFGQINPRVYIYIQPDFASAIQDNSNIGQIRDAYFDIGIDKKNEYRLRFGQSKIPFGFENMQSSQNRLPLDRNDGLNSAINNERDMGVTFYWAPSKIRERFARLVNSGLKGSGDYGVFAFGLFNGQNANKSELNNSPHVVSRLSYPFELNNGQIIESGIQAYSGRYVVSSVDQGVAGENNFEYRDQRAALSLVLYPQPLGIQAEYNIGTGPQFNSQTNSIQQRHLEGGYVLASWFFRAGSQRVMPFIRYQYYKGGKKFESDARSYMVKDIDAGIEWQPFDNFELVTSYTISDRKTGDALKPVNSQQGNLLRIQAQVNF